MTSDSAPLTIWSPVVGTHFLHSFTVSGRAFRYNFQSPYFPSLKSAVIMFTTQYLYFWNHVSLVSWLHPGFSFLKGAMDNETGFIAPHTKYKELQTIRCSGLRETRIFQYFDVWCQYCDVDVHFMVMFVCVAARHSWSTWTKRSRTAVPETHCQLPL